MTEEKKCENTVECLLEKTDKEDVKLVVKTLCQILKAVGYAVALGGFFAGLFYGIQILETYIPISKLKEWL